MIGCAYMSAWSACNLPWLYEIWIPLIRISRNDFAWILTSSVICDNVSLMMVFQAVVDLMYTLLCEWRNFVIICFELIEANFMRYVLGRCFVSVSCLRYLGLNYHRRFPASFRWLCSAVTTGRCLSGIFCKCCFWC